MNGQCKLVWLNSRSLLDNPQHLLSTLPPIGPGCLISLDPVNPLLNSYIINGVLLGMSLYRPLEEIFSHLAERITVVAGPSLLGNNCYMWCVQPMYEPIVTRIVGEAPDVAFHLWVAVALLP